MNLPVAKIRDETMVLDAADAVANAVRHQRAERVPDAGRAERLAGMRRSVQSMIARVPERSDVGMIREPGFVSSQIQRRDSSRTKFTYEGRGPQAVLFCVVSECAQNQARLDSGLPRHSFDRRIDDVDHPFRRQPTCDVKQRRKPQLGIDHAVASQLLKDIFDHDRQRFTRLQQRQNLRDA